MTKLVYLGLIIGVWACGTPSVSDVNPRNDFLLDTESVEGLHLIQQNCLSCHGIENNQDIIAPSLPSIRLEYLQEYPKEVDFIEKMTDFLSEPNSNNALIKKAVNLYGVMPKMPFNSSEFTKISKAFYSFPFDSISNIEEFKTYLLSIKTVSDTSILNLSKQSALKAKGLLGKNLLRAIQEKGTEHAVHFCSTKAIRLTDSLGNIIHKSIKRVSDKNRNPLNKVNANELALIAQFKQELIEGKELKGKLIEHEDHYTAYFPIITNLMCLQCHGDVEDNILPTTLKTIQRIYPNDRAINYQEGDLRGLWVIESLK